MNLSSLNQAAFEKGDLQSTLLDEEKMKLPDLDISDINGKFPFMCHFWGVVFFFLMHVLKLGAKKLLYSCIFTKGF